MGAETVLATRALPIPITDFCAVENELRAKHGTGIFVRQCGERLEFYKNEREDETPRTDAVSADAEEFDRSAPVVPRWFARKIELENARLRELVNPKNLADALVRAGIVQASAIDQAEGYDGGETLRQIAEVSKEILGNVQITDGVGAPPQREKNNE